MKKYIFSLATLALFSLEAAQFQYKTSITLSSTDTEQPQYLVQFEIDQISENNDPVEFTKPQVLCLLGTEGEVNKYVDGKGGYTVKALVYKADEKIKAKTSVVVLDENKNEVYKSDEERELDL
ncbi:MAG TPA: hypothetical protein VIJ14_07220 [Rhabdochlamydiaceae bacterium]